MLIKDPSKRIALDEIWRHDWLKDYSDMYPKQDKKKAAAISDVGVGKLTEFGYSKTAVLDSLQSGLMNHISATYHLLEALK